MSVLQPISFGLVHQVGPGDGAKGYGSYQADNTSTTRPYQQQAASPIGRGYSVSVISGAPTFFTPDPKEDPIITLLKMLVNQGKKVVKEKEPDAGFRNNLHVFPPAGPAGDPPTTGGRALGAAPAGQSPNEYEDSTLSGTTEGGLFKMVDDWLNRVGLALDRFMFEDPSVIEGSFSVSSPSVYGSAIGGPELTDTGVQAAAGGANIGTQAEDNSLAEELDVLQEAFGLLLGVYRNEAIRFNTANQYYAAMAEAAGVSSYDRTLNALNSMKDVQQLKQDILERFNMLVRGKAAELTSKEVKDQGVQHVETIERMKGVRPGRINTTNLPNYKSSSSGSASRVRDGRYRNDWNIPSISSSGSSFVPSPVDRRRESGTRTSPVGTRKKFGLNLKSM